MNLRALGRKGRPLEGRPARWYAATTRNDVPRLRELAERVAAETGGPDILEIGPGPGYLAIEMARLGLSVTGIDISTSLTAMAVANAAIADVEVDFRLGTAVQTGLPSRRFDYIVCRAAFKSISDPLAAIDEMHRLLKPGGSALVVDLRRDAARASIDEYINRSGRRRIDAWLTRLLFRRALLPVAYDAGWVRSIARRSAFGGCTVVPTPITYEARFLKGV